MLHCDKFGLAQETEFYVRSGFSVIHIFRFLPTHMVTPRGRLKSKRLTKPTYHFVVW
jgi:hypothetical protein